MLGHRGQPPVRLEAGRFPADVAGRDVGVHGNLDVHHGRLRDRLAPQRRDRLAHQAAVQVVPDRGDVARLGLAEQVAGAADLEVAHGDPVAGPELGGFADGLEPLVGVLAEHAVGRVEQVGVGPAP